MPVPVGMAFAFVRATMRAVKPGALWSVSALSAFAFVALARRVAVGATKGQDREVREELQKRRQPDGEALAHASGPLGKEWLHIPAAGALSFLIARKGRRRGQVPRALVPLLASIAAEASSRAFDRLPPHQRPPKGHPKPHKPSFPSGHALETTAVAATSAYVLAREELVSAPAAFGTAAALSCASTLGRLYLDRHWASDAAGGAALGLSIAAACAALYEIAHEIQPSRLQQNLDERRHLPLRAGAAAPHQQDRVMSLGTHL